MKRALITGVTGQDGAYLSQLLLGKSYEVHGAYRPNSTGGQFWRLERLGVRDGVRLHQIDMTDFASLLRIVEKVEPDEIYNLAAQSHVMTSFACAEATFRVNALGCQHLLDIIRTVGETIRFYQASTSELFGSSPPPQNEQTPFRPRSPYAVSKLAAYWATVNYREAFGLHASNGILFNHESPLRGEEFVTRKITRAIARNEILYLGNMNAQRDWGHARDYVEGMWRMLQQDEPGDYVLATGRSRSVRDFLSAALNHATTHVLVCENDKALLRPTEVESLCGDATKAREVLGWQPTTSFEDLVKEMVETEQ